MNIELIPSQSQWIERSKEIIFESLSLAQGAKSVVIPGGTTPLPILRELGKLGLPWHEVTMYQSDERITQDIEEANLTSQLISLTKEFVLQLDKFVLFNTDLEVEDMQLQYNSQLPLVPFDLVILGVGEDGHIASLFDLEDCLAGGDTIITQAPSSYISSERISLTLGRISSARTIMVLSRGDAKLERLQNPKGTPLELLLQLPQAISIHCMV
jgi:6-phosphogluconolactonase